MFTGKTILWFRAELTARGKLSFPGTLATSKPPYLCHLQQSYWICAKTPSTRARMPWNMKKLQLCQNPELLSQGHQEGKKNKKKHLWVTNPEVKQSAKAKSCLLWQVTLPPQVEVVLYIHINLQESNTSLLCSWLWDQAITFFPKKMIGNCTEEPIYQPE